MQPSSAAASSLSVHRAFVVQFCTEAQIATDRFSGRVQHISSHAAATFDSLDGLLEFFHQILRESSETPAEGK